MVKQEPQLLTPYISKPELKVFNNLHSIYSSQLALQSQSTAAVALNMLKDYASFDPLPFLDWLEVLQGLFETAITY